VTGIGLVGCGDMGRRVARDVVAVAPAAQVRALLDPDPEAVERARGDFPDAAPCADLDALLGRDDVDWVMIASPNRHHADQAVAALRAGRHVFLQKPIATTLEDALRIRAARDAAGREVVVGFNLRYAAHYRRIHALLADGAIGRLTSFEFNETLDWNHGGFIFGDWRRRRADAGTMLLEKCCHDVDVANWLTGSRVTRVASFGGRSFFTPANAAALERVGRTHSGRQGYMTWDRPGQRAPFTDDTDLVDHQVAILEYASGVRASFHFDANTALPERRLYLCGTEGTLRADLYGGRIELRRIGFGERVEDHGRGDAGLHGGGDAVLAEELAATMTSGHSPATTLEDGLAAAVVCLAVDEALEGGTVVDLAERWARVDRGNA
jgi:predicted dehydrogenase